MNLQSLTEEFQFSIKYNYSLSKKPKCTICKISFNTGDVVLSEYEKKKSYYKQDISRRFHIKCSENIIKVKSISQIMDLYNLKFSDQKLVCETLKINDLTKISYDYQVQNTLLWEKLEYLLEKFPISLCKEILINNSLLPGSSNLETYSKLLEGVVFGIPIPCNLCNSELVLKEDGYYCSGYREFKKCDYYTNNPTRKPIIIDNIIQKIHGHFFQRNIISKRIFWNK